MRTSGLGEGRRFFGMATRDRGSSYPVPSSFEVVSRSTSAFFALAFVFACAFAGLGCHGENASSEPAPAPYSPGFVTSVGDSSASSEDDQQVPTAARRLLVVYRSPSLPEAAEARLLRRGAHPRHRLDALGVVSVDADEATRASIERDPEVLAVGPERSWSVPSYVHSSGGRLPSAAPSSGFLWGLQWNVRRVGALSAWQNVPDALQAKVTVAVLDTGVMTDHPDLVGNVADAVDTSYARRPSASCPDPSASPIGYPAYFTRRNYETDDPCEPVSDTASIDRHGTHVAGIVAGRPGWGTGTTGVGPGLHLAVYKVFDRVRLPGRPTDSLLAFDGPVFAALVDAVQKRYPVVNLSLGGTIDRRDPSQEASYLTWRRVTELATARGTLIVAAAGNGALRTGTREQTTIPGDLPAVVSVAASGSVNLLGPFSLGDPSTSEPPVFGPVAAAPGSDGVAAYSNHGSTVDFLAPGGDCGPRFDPAAPETCEGQYLVWSSVPSYEPGSPVVAGWAGIAGTSMASPHVAAVAALIRAEYPSLGPAQIRARLRQTAERPGRLFSGEIGSGMIDASRATGTVGPLHLP